MRKLVLFLSFVFFLGACTNNGVTSNPTTTQDTVPNNGSSTTPTTEFELTFPSLVEPNPSNFIVGFEGSFNYLEQEQKIVFIEPERTDIWTVAIGRGLLGDGWEISVNNGSDTVTGTQKAEGLSNFTFPEDIDFEVYSNFTLTSPDGETIQGTIEPIFL